MRKMLKSTVSLSTVENLCRNSKKNLKKKYHSSILFGPGPLIWPHSQFESAITRQHVGKRETPPAPRCLFFCIRYRHRCLLPGAAGKACENSRGAGRRCGKQETWQ